MVWESMGGDIFLPNLSHSPSVPLLFSCFFLGLCFTFTVIKKSVFLASLYGLVCNLMQAEASLITNPTKYQGGGSTMISPAGSVLFYSVAFSIKFGYLMGDRSQAMDPTELPEYGFLHGDKSAILLFSQG